MPFNKLFEYAAAKIAIIAGDGPEVIRFASSYPALKFASFSVKVFVMQYKHGRPPTQTHKSISSYAPLGWDNEKLILEGVYAMCQGRVIPF